MARIITISNAEILEDASHSSLSSSATAADETISVYSISGFAVNKPLLIGEFGQQGSEIIKTHATTSPSGTTVTLVTGLTKSHPKDTKVYVLDYDQAQFFYATTATGDKTTISTSDLDEESLDTTYKDTTYTSGYYFTRFYNSINSNYSAYSDPIPYGGLASNTVGHIIDRAMKETKKDFNETLTYETLLDEINSCLRFVRGKLKRWSNVQEFDSILDQMNRGEYSWDLPSDYYDPNSNRSMLQVRVGANTELTYQDKKEFDKYFDDVVRTQVATQGEEDAEELVLDSTDDLPSSGTITYYISNTAYSVDFSANDKDTNTLTTDALEVTTPVDTNIWYGESEGTPEYFSIWDGKIYIWPLCNSTTYGENIYLDYYTEVVEVDSDADEITLARYDMIKHWVKWQIHNISEKNGSPDFKDGNWLMFQSCLNDAIRRESSGQKFKMKPQINGINYRIANDEFEKV